MLPSFLDLQKYHDPFFFFFFFFQMFDLLGFERFELIQSFLQHRSDVKNPPPNKEQQINAILGKSVR